jgi:hypothetical protein
MELATHIDKTLDLEIRAIEYRPDKRVVVVQFGVRRDHNPGLRRGVSSLCRSHENAHCVQSQRDHPIVNSVLRNIPRHVIPPVVHSTSVSTSIC